MAKILKESENLQVLPASKIRKDTWHKEVENFVQEHGAEKLLDLLNKQD